MRLVAMLLILGLAAPVRAEEPPARSEGVATALTMSATMTGFVLLAAGRAEENGWLAAAGAGTLLFLPSMGHWYAGEADGKGIGLRLAGGAMGVVALICWVDATRYFDNSPDKPEASFEDMLPTYVAGTVAASLFAWGLAHDWSDASAAARRHNLQFAPVLSGDVAGLGLSGRF